MFNEGDEFTISFAQLEIMIQGLRKYIMEYESHNKTKERMTALQAKAFGHFYNAVEALSIKYQSLHAYRGDNIAELKSGLEKLRKLINESISSSNSENKSKENKENNENAESNDIDDFSQSGIDRLNQCIEEIKKHKLHYLGMTIKTLKEDDITGHSIVLSKNKDVLGLLGGLEVIKHVIITTGE